MPKPTKTTTPRKRTTPAKRRAKPAAKSAAESVAAPQPTAKPRPSAPTKFRLKIFGTGGAGVNVINHISAAREQDGAPPRPARRAGVRDAQRWHTVDQRAGEEPARRGGRHHFFFARYGRRAPAGRAEHGEAAANVQRAARRRRAQPGGHAAGRRLSRFRLTRRCREEFPDPVEGGVQHLRLVGEAQTQPSLAARAEGDPRRQADAGFAQQSGAEVKGVR